MNQAYRCDGVIRSAQFSKEGEYIVANRCGDEHLAGFISTSEVQIRNGEERQLIPTRALRVFVPGTPLH